MNTINKLQFKHHSDIILGSTLEEARENVMQYIRDQWGNTIAADKENSPYRSLFAEPMVFKYAVEGDEENPHVMLLIGADNNTGNQVEYNKYCIIDIDKTEQEIEDLWEEIEKIIKSLAFTVFDSKTIDLSVERTELGTFLSGDVKTASTHTFSLDGDTIVKENNLLIGDGGASGPEGLFLYVDLIYDEENNKYVFLVNKADGTLKKVVLPNNYLVSGEYDVKDESIHLKMKDGEEVIVNCENLIAEWTVEGDASKTPIVLTREEVDYDGTDEHHHVEPWQDVLRADVRIASGRTNNILNKTIDGRYLYVDGEAKNIIYYWNGERTTVEQQLNKLNQIKISPDSDNIIWDSPAGYFATVDLEYISAQNKLRFTKTNVNGGTQTTELPLNTVTIIESITYDPVREVLVIKYRNDKGEIEYVEVPISGMIDEWEVLNNGHSVKLKKSRHISGKDILTADVNITNTHDEDNILKQISEGDLHALYVKGTADNIKEGIDGNVQVAINNLRAKDDEINGRLDEQQAEIEAVSADSKDSLKDIINNDHSINVDKSDAVRPIIKVNLSEQYGNNSIRLKSDGLYNFVDLTYDSETNKLKLIKSTSSADTNVEKEIKLDTISTIESITYDPHTEELIIVYYSGTKRKETHVPLRDLIDEWEIYNDPDSAVKLHRELVIDGKDKLSGLVVITSAHTDNILENSHGALYVPANTDVTRALSNAIEAEKTRAMNVEGALDTAITDERRRAEQAETAIRNDLTNAIHDEETRALFAESAIRNDLTNAISGETVRATLAEGTLQIALNAEIERSTNKDNELVNAIDAEKAAREAADDALEEAIEAATYHFDDTNTVDFTVAADKTVTANVKIANADNNMIKIPTSGASEGIFASMQLKYDAISNTLSLKTSANDTWEDFHLVGATMIDGIEYDSVNRVIKIKYTDGSGISHEVTVGVEDLFNDWEIANPSSGSAVELTKEIGSAGEKDKLYGKVLLTNLPDNAVQIVNNGLYVSNSASTSVECVSGKTDAIYKTLFGSVSPGGCGESIEYKPDIHNCIISAATSFQDADQLMAYQLCEILEMWVSAMTCTSVSNWIDDGANKKLEVDVRGSYGSMARMTDDDLYITDLTGKTIEPGVTEFTDTNALRIVCLEDGGSVIPDVKAKQNGLFLSNVWNCGKYYDSTDTTDMAGHDAVQADGYNADYWTDNDASASGYNYNNNVRQ